MITILPVKEKETIVKYYADKGIEFSDNASVVEAKFSDEVLGYCIFDLFSDGITVHTLEPINDIMLADGILRSALHIAAERSAMNALYSEFAPEELFEKLDFILDKKERKLNIDKLFGDCCCKK